MIDYKELAKYLLLGVGMGALFAGTVTTCTRAEARTIRFAPVVPTVPGIEAGRAPGYSPYPGPVREYAPSADVLRLYDEAPPNGCEPGRFRVVSGPPAQRGCY